MKYFVLFYDTDCPEGFAYVQDYQGNLCYYGSVSDCQKFIEEVEEELNT